MKGKEAKRLRRNNVYEYYRTQEEGWTEEEVNFAIFFCEDYQRKAYEAYYINGVRTNQPFLSDRETTALGDFFQTVKKYLPIARENLQLAQEHDWSRPRLYQEMRKSLSMDKVSRQDPIRYFLLNGYSEEETKIAIAFLTKQSKQVYEDVFSPNRITTYREYISKDKEKVTNLYCSLQSKLEKIHTTVTAFDQLGIDLEDLVTRMKRKCEITLKFCGRNNIFLYFEHNKEHWQGEEIVLCLQCLRKETQEQYRMFYDESGNLRDGIESSKAFHKIDSLFSSMRTHLRRNCPILLALHDVRSEAKEKAVVEKTEEKPSSCHLSNLSLAPALGALIIEQLNLLKDRKPILATLQKALGVSEDEAIDVMLQSIHAFKYLPQERKNGAAKKKI